MTSSHHHRTVARPPVTRSAEALLERAESVLREARSTGFAADRFRLAHLAALRAAAAVIAERAHLDSRRLRSAWVLLTDAAPELSAWAAYFASSATLRAAVEAGAVGAVSDHGADQQLHAAAQFVALARDAVGVLVSPIAS